MSHRKAVLLASSEEGFTITELVITLTVLAIVATTFYTAFKSSLLSYVGLQQDASGLTNVAYQSQRISTVVRGLTGIQSAAANDLVITTYFYPSDSYPSQVHYYLNSAKTQLLADVTPYSDNPPAGTPQTDRAKTYTIIDTYKQVNNKDLFQYYSTATSSPLTYPITDTNIIKTVQVNLATKTASGGDESMYVQVSLRNRKTNL